jgi:acylphosphatase
MPARLLRITGTVQGVFFRAQAQEMARELSITGWVRNTEDGAVEIHAEGKPENLRVFESWCRRGSPAARVEAVGARDVPEEHLTTFEILYR